MRHLAFAATAVAAALTLTGCTIVFPGVTNATSAPPEDGLTSIEIEETANACNDVMALIDGVGEAQDFGSFSRAYAGIADTVSATSTLNQFTNEFRVHADNFAQLEALAKADSNATFEQWFTGTQVVDQANDSVDDLFQVCNHFYAQL